MSRTLQKVLGRWVKDLGKFFCWYRLRWRSVVTTLWKTYTSHLGWTLTLMLESCRTCKLIFCTSVVSPMKSFLTWAPFIQSLRGLSMSRFSVPWVPLQKKIFLLRASDFAISTEVKMNTKVIRWIRLRSRIFVIIFQQIDDSICNAMVHFVCDFGHSAIRNPLPPSKMASLSTNAAILKFALNTYQHIIILLNIKNNTLRNEFFLPNSHFWHLTHSRLVTRRLRISLKACRFE